MVYDTAQTITRGLNKFGLNDLMAIKFGQYLHRLP
jgi:hypothetical protein